MPFKEEEQVGRRNIQDGWRIPRSTAPSVRRRLREQLLAAISPVLFGDPWESLDIVADFERQFGANMGYMHVSAVQSGSAGLRLSLLACGVGQGDEVITVANSDIATTAAISHCGATPVFCDVLASDFTMDPDRVESLITEQTVVILPVDLYGHPVNVRRLRDIADSHHLLIVEDATLAVGARDCGREVGAFADMAVFSCSPYKPFEGIGNGGVVVTEDKNLWEHVELLKGFGMPAAAARTMPVRYAHMAEGYNLPLSPINAAVLLVKLPCLKDWCKKRRLVGSWYAERLKGIEGVQLPSFRSESEPVFRTYTVRVRNRDWLYQSLREQGVEVTLQYVPPIHLQPVYRGKNLPGSDCLTLTERLGQEMLCLPVDPGFGVGEVDYVCNLLRSALDSLPVR